jgi:hypothetical protein
MSRGETDNRVIASRSMGVLDRRLGIHRRVIAGKPVPADLVVAYNEAIEAERPKAKPKTEVKQP